MTTLTLDDLDNAARRRLGLPDRARPRHLPLATPVLPIRWLVPGVAPITKPEVHTPLQPVRTIAAPHPVATVRARRPQRDRDYRAV